MTLRVAIVGGGIAGLSCAYELARLSRERGLGLDARLFEATASFGGVIRTEEREGFLLDIGPDSIFTEKPAALDLARELGLENEIVPTHADGKPVWISRRGRLRRLPRGLVLGAPTRLGPILRSDLFTPLGKARLFLEILIPQRRDGADESIASFFRRRLGREALDKFAEPILAGIWAGDAERLSLRSTFPRLAAMEAEHGCLARAVRRGSPSNRSGPRFVSFRRGMRTLVDALLAAIPPGWLSPGSPVATLLKTDSGFRVVLGDGETIEADGCVIAVPAHRAARVLRQLDPDLASGFYDIRCASTASVHLAHRREEVPHPLDGTGHLLPRSEGRRAFACTWVSSKIDGRAPEGRALFRVFFGGRRESEAELPEGDLVRLARDELRLALGIVAEPLFARVQRWSRANPQYEVGHAERVAAIDRRLAAFPGLFVAGSACRGVGIPDGVASGRETARALLEIPTKP